MFALLSAVLLAGSVPAAAEYPERPIKLVIPFPPGGETDPLARRITGALARNLRQPIVIENRPGANGAIAFEGVARAPKDGYTLLMGFSYMIVVNPHIYKYRHSRTIGRRLSSTRPEPRPGTASPRALGCT
jgi:tripartite-type tricarboxylate transporter receptor subunit TctC